VIDELARRAGESFGSGPADVLVARIRAGYSAMLAKPLTFMNLSGEAVGALARYYQIDVPDLLVIADDVNLPLGKLRARRGGSSGGHNGFKSIAQHLGTEEFPRLRVGVGRGDERRDLSGHVLGRFSPEEKQAIEDAVLRAADAAETFAGEGIDAVMRRFNADPAENDAKELSADESDSQKDSQS
jgi:peptidyl-tRNA hydrolase, PTH1 family